jgi:hypothetical protein
MNLMSSFEPPQELINAIVNGRCIAFVGAGFAAGAVPGWSALLKALAGELKYPHEPVANPTALQLEAFGQMLSDHAGGEHWEPAIQRVLSSTASEAGKQQLRRRRELLAQIPFRAVLTTNFDSSLEAATASLDAALYADVLREQKGRWWSAPQRTSSDAVLSPVIKLHGDANGDATKLPVVLGRADYRKRVYGDRNYANFLRSVFAQYTVLFLGVSFTDAYLNELRSEILHMVHGTEHPHPWGYAIMDQPGEQLTQFMRRHEGIELLPTKTHDEFDPWLEAIARRTSIRGRLERIFGGAKAGSIVWVDPLHEENNGAGQRLLEHAAVITPLSAPQSLDEHIHASAQVIITSFGHRVGHAFAVLERVRHWKERPPVIIFADPDAPDLAMNRRDCLRRGAWEYTVQWSELYRAIELVVGRIPGGTDVF